MDDDKVARVHAEIGRFIASVVSETKASGAVRLWRIDGSQLDFEKTVDAAEVRRLSDQGAGVGSRAGIMMMLLRVEWRPRGDEKREAG
jgi:hypothetical protein